MGPAPLRVRPETGTRISGWRPCSTAWIRFVGNRAARASGYGRVVLTLSGEWRGRQDDRGEEHDGADGTGDHVAGRGLRGITEVQGDRDHQRQPVPEDRERKSLGRNPVLGSRAFSHRRTAAPEYTAKASNAHTQPTDSRFDRPEVAAMASATMLVDRHPVSPRIRWSGSAPTAPGTPTIGTVTGDPGSEDGRAGCGKRRRQALRRTRWVAPQEVELKGLLRSDRTAGRHRPRRPCPYPGPCGQWLRQVPQCQVVNVSRGEPQYKIAQFGRSADEWPTLVTGRESSIR